MRLTVGTEANVTRTIAVLRAVPDATLTLMVPAGHYRDALLLRMAALGVVAERVLFEAYRPRLDYLKTYRRIDLCLDTLPYNGHTTSLDSFWMGVPVVTCIGQTCVGRAGLSQLRNLGLEALAAPTAEDFVRVAVALAGDVPRLSQLRAQLRSRMQASPLMDGAAFARAMEAALLQARSGNLPVR